MDTSGIISAVNGVQVAILGSVVPTVAAGNTILTGIATQLGTIAASVTPMLPQIAAIAAATTAMVGTVQYIQSAVETGNTNLVGIKDAVNNLNTELKTIQTKQDQFSGQFDARMNEQRQYIDQLETITSDISSKLSQSLDKQDFTNLQLDYIRENVFTLNQTAVEQLKAAQDTNEELRGVYNQIVTTNSKLEAIDSDFAKVDTTNNWLQSIYDSIQNFSLPTADSFCQSSGLWFCSNPNPPAIEPQELETKNIEDMDISPKVSSSGSCPADITVSITSGNSLTFSFQPICDFASLIRPLVIALAYLASARLLINDLKP
ncbi:hypothetical protein JCM14076_15920 [Methylosoma difficile]